MRHGAGPQQPSWEIKSLRCPASVPVSAAVTMAVPVMVGVRGAGFTESRGLTDTVAAGLTGTVTVTEAHGPDLPVPLSPTYWLTSKVYASLGMPEIEPGTSAKSHGMY